jgi:hypothetical protein
VFFQFAGKFDFPHEWLQSRLPPHCLFTVRCIVEFDCFPAQAKSRGVFGQWVETICRMGGVSLMKDLVPTHQHDEAI